MVGGVAFAWMINSIYYSRFLGDGNAKPLSSALILKKKNILRS